MSHLSCKTHKKRVLVVNDLRHVGQWVVLHRANGSTCGAKTLVWGGKQYPAEDIRGLGHVPNGKTKVPA